MPSKSKSKGNNFERETCKYLSDLTGLSFTRVPNSGAFLGGKNISRVENLSESQVQIFDGDIIVPDELKDWSIECKFYKDFAWKKLFQSDGESQLNGWIKQAEETSKPYWFLLFKINNAGKYLVISKETMYHFKFKFPICYSVYQKEYLIMDMESFFNINWKRIIE